MPRTIYPESNRGEPGTKPVSFAIRHLDFGGRVKSFFGGLYTVCTKCRLDLPAESMRRSSPTSSLGRSNNAVANTLVYYYTPGIFTLYSKISPLAGRWCHANIWSSKTFQQNETVSLSSLKSEFTVVTVIFTKKQCNKNEWNTFRGKQGSNCTAFNRNLRKYLQKHMK